MDSSGITGLGVALDDSEASSVSLVAVTPGTKFAAGGMGIGDTSNGRKLRRLAERGVGDVVGGTRSRLDTCGLSTSWKGLGAGCGIGGESVGDASFRASLDAFFDRLGGKTECPPGELSRRPVVEIRTSI